MLRTVGLCRLLLRCDCRCGPYADSVRVLLRPGLFPWHRTPLRFLTRSASYTCVADGVRNAAVRDALAAAQYETGSLESAHKVCVRVLV